MARRHLSSEEQAIWTALTQSVKPLRPGARTPARAAMPIQPAAPIGLTKAPVPVPFAAPARTPAAVLDSGWERRIRNGNLAPDMSIDLHGNSLAGAHARLNQALAAAWARDTRVLLVVTGKPPKSASSQGDSRRGAIRGEISHWLETSSYADRIASVRIAHQRHGGDGALYIILRRKK
jgi:DNA-nicking Smr family endonuclease